jgi:hypothetical protein
MRCEKRGDCQHYREMEANVFRAHARGMGDTKDTGSMGVPAAAEQSRYLHGGHHIRSNNAGTEFL